MLGGLRYNHRIDEHQRMITEKSGDMAVLRIYAPAFSFEQKKIMARELTDALWQALALPDEARKCTSIHFVPYALDQMAVEGRLLSETEEPQYQLEFHYFALSPPQKESLIQTLLPLLLELLGLSAADAHRLLILFQDYEPHSIYCGQQFITAQPKKNTLSTPHASRV